MASTRAEGSTHAGTAALDARRPTGARVRALDGLRALAILAVLGFHYVHGSHHLPVVREGLWLARSGWLGVDLFFVLSGFLITGILLDTKGAPRFFSTFYVRRTLRIFPLYYGVLVAVFGALAWVPAMRTEPFVALEARQAYLWTYTSNWLNVARGELSFASDVVQTNHFWSLALEEQFYLVWPLLVWALPKRRLAVVAAAGVASTYALGALIAPDIPTSMALRGSGLLLGGLVAIGERAEWARARFDRVGAPLLAITLVLVGALFFARSGLIDEDVVARQLGVPLVHLFFASALVVAIRLRPESIGHRLLASRPLEVIGRYSYGLYVFHWAIDPGVEALRRAHLDFPWTSSGLVDELLYAALRAGLAFALAVASYHLYETRFLALAERLRPKARAEARARARAPSRPHTKSTPGARV